jgi:hypothetical protein
MLISSLSLILTLILDNLLPSSQTATVPFHVLSSWHVLFLDPYKVNPELQKNSTVEPMKNLFPNIRPFRGMSGFGQRFPKHKQNIALDLFHSFAVKKILADFMAVYEFSLCFPHELLMPFWKVPSNISYKSLKNFPMQNSYCDHRNFDSINQPQD